MTDEEIAKQVYRRLVGVKGTGWFNILCKIAPDNSPDYTISIGRQWLCDECGTKALAEGSKRIIAWPLDITDAWCERCQ